MIFEDFLTSLMSGMTPLDSPSDMIHQSLDIVRGIDSNSVRGYFTEVEFRYQGKSGGNGSGLLISDKHVLTVHHVGQYCQMPDIKTIVNGRAYDASLEWTASPQGIDLAVIRLEQGKYHMYDIQFANSEVELGDRVTMFGSFMGMPYRGRGRVDDTEGLVTALESFTTDTLMRKGASGGPVINSKGEVVGVASYGFGAFSSMGEIGATKIQPALEYIRSLR